MFSIFPNFRSTGWISLTLLLFKRNFEWKIKMRRKTCLLFIFILCIEQISCLGLKTNCYVEGTSSQAICTCGGEYKWGEHGGGRFGVDLFKQIIWSRGSENIQDLKTITYEDCNSNSIFTLDLDAKYPNVNLIEFKNSGLGCSFFS